MKHRTPITRLPGGISRFIVCLVLGLGWLLPGLLAATELPAAIKQALVAQDIPQGNVSLYVSRLSAPSPRLALNASVPRNPASVMKLLTSLLALDTLGPDYRWRTEAYIKGTLAQGELAGDLILKGYGDPYLTAERLWRFLYELRQRGIRTIRGDLVVDGSHFLPATARRGDFDGRPRRAYNALPHALSLNFQATEVHLLPDPPARTVHAFTYPPLANLEISNRMRLVSDPCRQPHLRPRLRFAEHAEGTRLELQGEYAANCPEWSNIYLIMDPVDHLGGTFEALWQALGGEFEGTIEAGLLPGGAKRLHHIESPPLAEVIRGINKYSNNLMSRMLLLTVAAETRGAPASADQAQDLLADWLHSWKLPSRRVRVNNGSGLARDARVSAELVGHLLQAAFDSPLMPEFMASLPIVGIDGTMQRRLRGSGVAGRAHIKTGSLNDVSSMAGYVLDRQGRRWVVALIINHAGLAAWQGKQVQDAVLRWVHDGPARGGDGATRVADNPTSECPDEPAELLQTAAVDNDSSPAE